MMSAAKRSKFSFNNHLRLFGRHCQCRFRVKLFKTDLSMVAQFCERSLLCVNVFQITLKISVITVTADDMS